MSAFKARKSASKARNDVLQSALIERKVLLDALRKIARDYSVIVEHTVSDEAKALIGAREPEAAAV